MAACVLLLTAGPAWAQTGVGTLTGTVTTAAGQPVPFATVAVLNSTLGATADQGGGFSIKNVPAGRQTVAVSSVGYATRTQTVELATGQAVPLSFQLPASTAGLGEVVVSAQKEETNLQKTPMAVSALGTKQLREYRVWDFKDLTALAPNLFVIEHGNSTGSNFLNIRGVMGFRLARVLHAAALQAGQQRAHGAAQAREELPHARLAAASLRRRPADRTPSRPPGTAHMGRPAPPLQARPSPPWRAGLAWRRRP